jgi:polysaccharide biosynthesis protein PslG
VTRLLPRCAWISSTGKITWNPLYGAKIVWADGHGPATTPPSTAPPEEGAGNPIVAVLTLLSNLLASLGGR